MIRPDTICKTVEKEFKAKKMMRKYALTLQVQWGKLEKRDIPYLYD